MLWMVNCLWVGGALYWVFKVVPAELEINEKP